MHRNIYTSKSFSLSASIVMVLFLCIVMISYGQSDIIVKNSNKVVIKQDKDKVVTSSVGSLVKGLLAGNSSSSSLPPTSTPTQSSNGPIPAQSKAPTLQPVSPVQSGTVAPTGLSLAPTPNQMNSISPSSLNPPPPPTQPIASISTIPTISAGPIFSANPTVNVNPTPPSITPPPISSKPPVQSDIPTTSPVIIPPPPTIPPLATAPPSLLSSITTIPSSIIPPPPTSPSIQPITDTPTPLSKSPQTIAPSGLLNPSNTFQPIVLSTITPSALAVPPPPPSPLISSFVPTILIPPTNNQNSVPPTSIAPISAMTPTPSIIPPPPPPTLNNSTQSSAQPTYRPTLSSPPTLSPAPPTAYTYTSNEPTNSPSLLFLVNSNPSPSPTSLPSYDPTTYPTQSPSNTPRSNPTDIPPSLSPSIYQTDLPSVSPSTYPTVLPSVIPSIYPTVLPSVSPSTYPTDLPSVSPSTYPTVLPSVIPSIYPTVLPSVIPSIYPTVLPSVSPSTYPTDLPSVSPSIYQTDLPSVSPSTYSSDLPSVSPSTNPTVLPSVSPSTYSSDLPSVSPSTDLPSVKPSIYPIDFPNVSPSIYQTVLPSVSPSTYPTDLPSFSPSIYQTDLPSVSPSTNPTVLPSIIPSIYPTVLPSVKPSIYPIDFPNVSPSIYQTDLPSVSPSTYPTDLPSVSPSTYTTDLPSVSPTTYSTDLPSVSPSTYPTSILTSLSTVSPTDYTTIGPTILPSVIVSNNPTAPPSVNPIYVPVSNPSSNPTIHSTSNPSDNPSSNPSATPLDDTSFPSSYPNLLPTSIPLTSISEHPSTLPSFTPTISPSFSPTFFPSNNPTNEPTAFPSIYPTIYPTFTQPSNIPSYKPSVNPTIYTPSFELSTFPSPFEPATSTYPTTVSLIIQPSNTPSNIPSIVSASIIPTLVTLTSKPTYCPSISSPSPNPIVTSPSVYPTVLASSAPTVNPSTSSPSIFPTTIPTNSPTINPSFAPTTNPSKFPFINPTIEPTNIPTFDPSHSKTLLPSAYPSISPTAGSSNYPTLIPTNLVNSRLSNNYPVVLSPLKATTTETTVIVLVNVSSPGYVYCAALSSSFNLSSGVYIKQFGSSAVLSGYSGGVVTIDIRNLIPSSNYAIYCYTEDFASNYMPISAVKQTKVLVSTQCCRNIQISSYNQYIPVNISTKLTFSIAALPVLAMTVNIVASPYQINCPVTSLSNTRSALSIVPSSFSIFSSSLSNINSFLVSSNSPGCYSLILTSSSTDYVYTNISNIFFYSSVSPLPAPQLQSAVFSNDGRQIFVTFNSLTNYGIKVITNYLSTFRCSNILNFNTIGQSTCQWSMSGQQIVVTLDSASTVNVGQTVNIIDNVIQANNCNSNNICSAYTSSSQKIAISSPSIPVIPIVSLSSSQVVSSCDDIVIDPTNSNGFGGRSWTSVVWTVTSSNLSTDDITNYLNNNYQSTNQVVVIPNSFLSGGSYSVSLQLTNFFSQSSTAILTITVSSSTSVPTISISGPNTIVTYRNQSLDIFAFANVAQCGQTTSQSSALTYQWSIYEGSNILSLKSISNDPRHFTLASYTLDSSTTYTVQVTVTSSGNTIDTSSASVLVQVGQSSGVKAVIRGGNQLTVYRSIGAIIIDASDSYIIDYPQQTDLIFQWICVIQSSSNYGNSCPFIDAVVTTSSTLSLDISSIDVDYKYFYISVSVTEKSTEQTDIAGIYVTIASDPIPIVTFGKVNSKYNPNDNIVLTAEITTTNEIASALWSSSTLSSSSMLLTSIASSPTVYTSLPAGITSIVQLSIPSHNLISGNSYLFQLVANYPSTPSFAATAEVTIVMNSPPSGGNLDVSPESGIALLTTFKYNTYLWSDDISDYPLTYVMLSFTNPLDVTSRTVIKSGNQLAYGSSTLGQGISSYNYSVSVVAVVYDSYNSSANITEIIQVFPSVASTSTLYSILTESLSSASLVSDSDQIVNSITSVLQTVNAVDCSAILSSYCSTVNRSPCSQVANTCGECLSGYLGQSGSSNSMCHTSTAVKAVGSSCQSDSDCVTNSCITTSPTQGVCSYNNKPCPNNCNSQGTCVFQAINDSTIIYSKCLENDSSCTALCSCSSNHYGADCSLSQDDYNNLIAIRTSMCSNLLNSLSIQNINSETIISLSNTLSSALSDITQLSNFATEQCVGAIVTIVNKYPIIAGSPQVYSYVYNVLSTVLSINYLSNLPSFYYNDTSSSLFTDVSNALSLLSHGIQSNKAIGEFPTISTSANLKSIVYLQDPCAAESISLSIPLTAYEAFNGETSPSVSSPTSGHCGVYNGVGLQVLQNNGPRKGNLVASSVGVQSTTYFVNAYGGRRLTGASTTYNITLPVSKPLSYSTSSSHKSSVAICEPRIPVASFHINVDCPDTSSGFQLFCPGNETRVYQYTCPEEYMEPECVSSNDGYSFSSDPNCHLVDASDNSVTCLCTAESSYRRLALIENQKTESIQFSASTNIVLRDFTSNWKSAANLNSSTITHNLVITITMAVVMIITIVGVFSFVIIDVKEDKLKPAAKLNKKKRIGTQVKHFFNSLLPIEYTGQPWLTRLYHRMKLEHDWLCLFLPFSTDRDYRSIRWVRAMGRVLHMLFVDTILAGLYFADDGTCEGYYSQSTCLKTMSLDRIESLCDWSINSNTCSFNHGIGKSIFSTLVITTVITIVTIPFDAIFIFMVRKIKDLVEYKANQFKVNNDHEVDISAGLHDLQTTHSKLFRAARLVMHQSNMSISVDEEVSQILDNATTFKHELQEKNLSRNKETSIDLPSDSDILVVDNNLVYNSISFALNGVSFLLDEPADPLTIAKAINAANSNVTNNQISNLSTYSKLILKNKILTSRKHSDHIVNQLGQLESKDMKDVYLLQQFLVHCLSGLKQKIAYRYFFSEIESKSKSGRERTLQYVCVALLPLYIIALSVYVFLFGVRIGSRATNIWLLGILISLLQSIFILQPIRIWLQFTVISNIADEVRLWHGLLRERAKSIMSRSSGLVKEKNILIQHINPACRAACLFPHLPSSRLIMAINDYDLPTSRIISSIVNHSYLHKVGKAVFFVVAVGLFLLTLLPAMLQDGAIEGIASPVVGILILILAYTSRESIAIPIIISIVIVFFLVLYQMYLSANPPPVLKITEPICDPVENKDDILNDKPEIKPRQSYVNGIDGSPRNIRKSFSRDSVLSLKSLSFDFASSPRSSKKVGISPDSPGSFSYDSNGSPRPSKRIFESPLSLRNLDLVMDDDMVLESFREEL